MPVFIRGLLVIFFCQVTPNTFEQEYTKSTALFFVRISQPRGTFQILLTTRKNYEKEYLSSYYCYIGFGVCNDNIAILRLAWIVIPE